MNDINKTINNLTEEELTLFKKELYKKGLRLNGNNQILKRKKNKRAYINEINPIEEMKFYNLSNAQRRMWILNQIDENNIAYNIPGSFILEGELDEASFSKAYTYIIDRHESLRTIFKTVEDEAKQKILDNPDFKIKIIDLKETVNKDLKVKELVKKEVCTSFDLEKGPLVKFTILRLEDNKNLLLFNMHHIISDGWSMDIFTSEFLGAYNSFRENRTPIFEPLRLQYRDYSAWQNALLESSEMKDQREYWLDKLSGEIPVLDLPVDMVRPGVQTYNGNIIGFSLSKDINTDLNNLCREYQVSLFMLFQALIKTLFYKYTGQEDIILGSPVAGRVHEDLENQIGLYINTLAFRDSLNGELEFTELLVAVSKTCTDAFENQDYPFDKLVEDLNLKRDVSRSPLFDAVVILQNNESSEINFDGLKVFPYDIENQISKFDMTFNFSEMDNGLDCKIEYNTDIYNTDRIERMIENLKTLISSVIENPESRIKNLEIITKEEKSFLLNVFNDTKADFPEDKTVVDLFEERVEKTPDNIAVIYEDIELTYRELNEKANIVANYLKDNYVIQPDDLIGLMLSRTEMMIIALLGILKSGAAYVPIDPDYPEERISYLLTDSNPKLVIANNSDENNVGIREILNSDYVVENPEKITASESLAYVIYTSGSTGKPKGVMIQHKNIIRLIYNQIFTSFKKDDRLLLTGSISFDISTYEIWAPVINGVPIILTDKENILDINKFGRILQENKITVLHLIPQLFNQLAREDISVFQKLRFFLIGGDLVEPTYVCKLKELYPHIKIFHMYGPTENTTFSTCFEVDKDYGKLPIGRPLSNSSVYILSNDNQLQALGIDGEICVSGEGVAKGYLNDIQLTNKKFIYNPKITDERIYKTGDLGRWNVDGNLEFVGRIDSQVKIRGFRIELGEIENTLILHDEIRSAVVLVVDGKEDEKRLVAYYVSDDDLELSELRIFTSKLLPDYMVPSYFIHMNTFPLTPNGKIDRKFLPETDVSTMTRAEYVAPRNETEEKLVQIWQEILKIEKIGINDNFFDLGGHSLNATRVVFRINKKFEVKIAIGDIFENPIPTIESLSLIINRLVRTNYSQIEAISTKDSYELSNAQRRLWVMDQLEEQNVVYNMPNVFYLKGNFNEEAFKKSYSYIVERHESLRTVFIKVNDYPRQKVLDNPNFTFEIKDLRDITDNEAKAEEFAQEQVLTPFDLENGPLIRFSLFRVEDDKYLVLLNMHHIISDGWSMNILTREFLVAYNTFRRNKTPDLPPLRIQYKDYSVWQNNMLDGDDLDLQREYWLEKLSGDLPLLDLPADNVRPIIQTFNGKSLDFTLSERINSRINNLCKENHVTLFMMLQTIIKILFYRYTGQNDIILGSPIAGRTHEALENQIGFYVNTLVLRDTINGESTFNEFLKAVSKTSTDAFENQDYPFDRLVEDLDIKRDLSRSPLFDVLMVLQNNESTELEFDGLNIIPCNIENTISKFDMSFNFAKKGEGLFCCITYNTNIYAEDRIERMVEHLKTLISSVLGNPESKIQNLEIIPEEEKNSILNVFNNTKVDYPVDKTIIDLFEEQVEKTPDNIALVFEEIELSYRELNEKANKVAHFLRDNYAIESDDLVAVLLERSDKMIITLLGILKSGAGYLPIDTTYPERRIDFMLEDSTPKVLLSERNTVVQKNIDVLDINMILNTKTNTKNPELKIKSSNMAYIIYTSGSSGKSKGTVIQHGGLFNYLCWIIDNYSKNIGNSCHLTSYAFDLSITGMYPPLITGNSLSIYDPHLDVSNTLYRCFTDPRVNTVKLTPSHISMLENMDIDSTNISLIFSGGDDLTKQDINTLRRINPDIEIINHYGPTESTVGCIAGKVESGCESIYIGKPISNTNIYMLDKDKQLLPLGIPGELCISGSGLARGYLNRADLTARKFVEKPCFFEDRMYFSGDLARWLPDGNIEFLGRIDNQVKIRGFRIELSEIENALLQHDRIKEVFACKTESINDLCVYYTLDEENSENNTLIQYNADIVSTEHLRNYLLKSLPDFMIPTFFIQMVNFPLTLNGKIDRKALPEPDRSVCTGQEYVAPENEVQETLVEIWQEVLGVKRVGILDDFFDLGGHSLKLTSIVSRINSYFEMNITMMDIFKSPTIASLSLEINAFLWTTNREQETNRDNSKREIGEI